MLGAFETFYKNLYTAQNKEQFDDNFKRKTENMLNESYKHKQDFLETDITENELVTILSKLKRREAPRCDLVQNEHILFGGRTLRVVLLKLYNAILYLELVPRIWKKGLIIPIFKGHGKSRSAVENYRLVTLLSVLYKIYEMIFRGRITLYFDANNKLFPNRQQQGFQHSLSCCSRGYTI